MLLFCFKGRQKKSTLYVYVSFIFIHVYCPTLLSSIGLFISTHQPAVISWRQLPSLKCLWLTSRCWAFASGALYLKLISTVHWLFNVPRATLHRSQSQPITAPTVRELKFHLPMFAVRPVRPCQTTLASNKSHRYRSVRRATDLMPGSST